MRRWDAFSKDAGFVGRVSPRQPAALALGPPDAGGLVDGGPGVRVRAHPARHAQKGGQDFGGARADAGRQRDHAAGAGQGTGQVALRPGLPTAQSARVRLLRARVHRPQHRHQGIFFLYLSELFLFQKIDLLPSRKKFNNFQNC
jgi:hypothetical protein